MELGVSCRPTADPHRMKVGDNFRPQAVIRFRQHYDEAHRTEQSLRTIVEQLLILVGTHGIEGGSQRQKNSSRLVNEYSECLHNHRLVWPPTASQSSPIVHF